MWNRMHPTVFEWKIGEIKSLTPQSLLGSDERLSQLDGLAAGALPWQLARIEAAARPDGVILRIPMGEGERFYGLGLQLLSFLQNGRRKKLKANADAVADTGESHGPVPFYVSSDGYGVLIDSAATVEISFGRIKRLRRKEVTGAENLAGTSTEELYKANDDCGEVTIFVRGVKGLRLYAFAAGSMKGAVEQYNLFCGGGCMPPLWGLGNLYRCYTRADQADVERMIRQLAADEMPISMLGLEPGWHSHSYSCSFVWSERFPEPEKVMTLAKEHRMKLNMWEQAYVHPMAPFYEEILPYSGDYEVWDGAVPDFALEEARKIYGKRQEELIEEGISAVKLDECDGSDYTGGWFFPEYAQFPSGLTGDEEKNLYGAMVIRAIQAAFKKQNKRTWSQARANYSYGAPMPYVLYSDLYDHRVFVRGVVNAGISGLLWTPEVRQCDSADELVRRIQATVFSPMSQINAWSFPNPPWKQFLRDKNRCDELLDEEEMQKLQDRVRKMLKVRNQLVPYLYSAYYLYEKEGTPAFRPLVLDFPGDENIWEMDDCYMMGDALLVAPVIAPKAGEKDPGGREVYLPAGNWYDFWTEEKYEGGQIYRIETENIPVFVREGSILPLACETDAPDGDSVFSLEIRAYGENPKPFVLVEDDGVSYDYREGKIRLITIDENTKPEELAGSARYRIAKQRRIGK